VLSTVASKSNLRRYNRVESAHRFRFQCLKGEYHYVLSTVAFKSNPRRYGMVAVEARQREAEVQHKVGRCRLNR